MDNGKLSAHELAATAMGGAAGDSTWGVNAWDEEENERTTRMRGRQPMNLILTPRVDACMRDVGGGIHGDISAEAAVEPQTLDVQCSQGVSFVESLWDQPSKCTKFRMNIDHSRGTERHIRKYCPWKWFVLQPKFNLLRKALNLRLVTY